MRDAITAATTNAMRAGDKLRLETLRMVAAAIKNADIAARGEGKPPLPGDAILGILQKLIKQRQESAELYDKGGRAELATKERDEIGFIEAFLPAQIAETEMEGAIADIVEELGATGPKDMGKVMAALKAAYPGRMDFAKASVAVKKVLGA
ncbi:MAG: GatB/YqeY domain-containing protein [Bauldia sp.]